MSARLATWKRRLFLFMPCALAQKSFYSGNDSANESFLPSFSFIYILSLFSRRIRELLPFGANTHGAQSANRKQRAKRSLWDRAAGGVGFKRLSSVRMFFDARTARTSLITRASDDAVARHYGVRVERDNSFPGQTKTRRIIATYGNLLWSFRRLLEFLSIVHSNC